ILEAAQSGLSQREAKRVQKSAGPIKREQVFEQQEDIEVTLPAGYGEDEDAPTPAVDSPAVEAVATEATATEAPSVDAPASDASANEEAVADDAPVESDAIEEKK
ncbi:MAG: hypothetical protein VX014_06825, partial [Verrucomicrobiota bacterium]|nr:hypothetical protein [Verrucomicrobiota bacterium]